MLRVVPMERAERAPQVRHQTTPVATAPVVDQTPQVAEAPVIAPTTLMTEATTEDYAAEETLPEAELPMAQEPAAETTTAEAEIQIPTWNLGERIPIAP
jgi:hypothetical protein